MRCGACSSKITEALTGSEGVLNATVDHASGQAEIEIDNTKITSAVLIETINALGFTATATP
jgi:copper chaperone CopZ